MAAVTLRTSLRLPLASALMGLFATLGSAAAAQSAQPAQAEAEAARTARNLAKTHEVARCLVRDFRPLAAGIFEDMPGTLDEQTRLAQLRRRGVRCVEATSKAPPGKTYVASWDIAAPALRGALAEALYEADFSEPGRVRPGDLARVAPVGRTAPARAPAGEDPAAVRRFAACAVRSAPDDAAALLAIEPGSAAESETVRRLVREFDACFPAGDRRSINVPNVRGLVAEALYRHRSAVARGEPPGPGERVERRLAATSGDVVIVPAAASGAAGPSESYGAEDVRTLNQVSRCVARRRSADMPALLTMDYRDDSYDRTAKAAMGRSTACVPRGRLRFSRLLFAGGIAEEMLAAKPGVGGLQANVSTGAPGTALKDGDVTQSIGSCLVRSRPASVAGLLATAPASAEEDQAVRNLAPDVARCVAPGQTVRIGQPSLRAVTAIAAYRLVQQQAAAPRPGRN